MSSTEIPASPGVHGPGDTTIALGAISRTCSTVTASLRKIASSAPSSAKYWTRL